MGSLISTSAIGAMVAFFWSVYQFFNIRKNEAYAREFEAFHKLVKELVEPNSAGTTYLDRQAAIAFELRNFKRYHEFILRMLKHLVGNWVNKPNTDYLINEINETIKFIEKK